MVSTSNGTANGFQVIDVQKRKCIHHVYPVFPESETADDDDVELYVDALAVTCDGKYVLLGSYMTNDVHFYNPATGEKLKTLEGTWTGKKIFLKIACRLVLCGTAHDHASLPHGKQSNNFTTGDGKDYSENWKVSPDDRYLFWPNGDKIGVWDLEKDERR